MMDIPMHYHLVQCSHSVRYVVDSATRKEIEHWLNDPELPRSQILNICSSNGADITLVRGHVIGIEETSPAFREHDREHTKRINMEQADQGYTSEDLA